MPSLPLKTSLDHQTTHKTDTKADAKEVEKSAKNQVGQLFGLTKGEESVELTIATDTEKAAATAAEAELRLVEADGVGEFGSRAKLSGSIASQSPESPEPWVPEADVPGALQERPPPRAEQ